MAAITAIQLLAGVVLIGMGVTRRYALGWALILLGLLNVWSAAWTWLPGAGETLRLAVLAALVGALAVALSLNRRWDLWTQVRLYVLLGGAAIVVIVLLQFGIPEASRLQTVGLVTLVLLYVALIASFCIRVIPRLLAKGRPL